MPPFLLNLDGTAGTGKTFTVNAICQTAADLVGEASMGNMVIVKRLAPTGIAAFHIHDSTYHSALGTSPKTNKGKAAAGRRLAALQDDWKYIRYLIIDEKSMVGRMGLALIDKRLREIFPHRNVWSGGLSVILCGDFGQQPPVGDMPLYCTDIQNGISDRSNLLNHGRFAYLAFTESLELDVGMRQAGLDETTRKFKEHLLRSRAGKGIEQDFADVVQTRFFAKLPVDEQKLFDRATRLCAASAHVQELNLSALYLAKKPVLRVSAVHTGVGAEKRRPDDADSLMNVVVLMEGAKVMLTRNLWVDQGLTNGSMG